MAINQAVVQPARRPFGLAGIASLGYLVSWIAGLSIGSANTTVNASDAQDLAGYVGHEGSLTLQFVLTEGLPAVALAVVALAVARAARRAGAVAAGRTIAVSALASATLSLVLCVLGLVITLVATPNRDAHLVGTLVNLINRLDGAKMFLLAGVGVGALLAHRTRVLPGWLTPVAGLMALALVASGIGYLFLLSALSVAAYLSLPLLLVWFGLAGLLLRRVNA